MLCGIFRISKQHHLRNQSYSNGILSATDIQGPIAMRLLSLLFLLTSISTQAAEPDWQAVEKESLTNLSALIRLDTSQPEGNEILAATYLQQVLAEQDIDSTIYESAPSRASIVARLKGNGERKPLLLLGHLDVVTVEPENWSFDPFAGTVEDGKIYGRGSADDKEVVAGTLQVFMLLKRLNISLSRDVIFLGVADEEGGGALGITYMMENHLDEIRAEFAINEGGWGYMDPVTHEYVRFNIGTAEKTPRRARLIARGLAGHGSVPTRDNPIGVLSRAVARIFDSPLPMRLNETTRTFFERLAANSPAAEADIYRAILQPNASTEMQERLRTINPSYYSMIRTSVAPTIFRGGYQRNVIPSEAEVTLDIRALPDENPDELFEALVDIAGEPSIEIIPMEVTRPAHAPSPLHTELFHTLESVLRERHPMAVILPSMSTGASDSAQLRAAGIPTYGFGAGSIQGEQTGVHGNDEFLRVDAYMEYIRILWEVVTRVVSSK
jgi:acetylornithine deacetylase/succinyl-diaminopimelate desuccinylase-like protein